ncbi:class I SAM-dependent methyltransferase [Microvirga puerhi]|uniref:Methyltransferase domain-containing protein n=1 Tax=Microvirga puerhi TaxID=2876078 RepID=A0ABS7VKW9_9HYPH|nr:methyltransferase domain-containing protein [Microvirga puerhi]MBZ6075879.1 methyltransferase domain-containing protein [Microvirga puerhi]
MKSFGKIWAEVKMNNASLRATVSRHVPYPVIETSRRVVHFGFSHKCHVCGARVRRLLPQGYGYPLLERLQVVGGMYKDNDRCPICHAGERDRLVKFYLERHIFNQSPRPITVVHMAPEKGLTRYFQSKPGLQYHLGDIEPHRYRHATSVQKMNLLNMPLDNGSADVFVCNHVLEHIVDDLTAMREIHRVLSPTGVAVLQVPIALKLERTIEGDGTETEDEKLIRYGQRDHVRIYNETGYTERLEAAGFSVEHYSAFDDSETAAAEWRLNPFEILHVCRRRKGTTL